jgi:hypothetical protein
MWPFNRRNHAARSGRRNGGSGPEGNDKKSVFSLPGTREEILEKYRYRC